MAPPRPRARAKRSRSRWYAAAAAAFAGGTLLFAFSCATQESHDFSNGVCVAGGCEELAAGVSGSASSSSGICVVDAGCPVSFATDIYAGLLDTSLAKCTNASCHGNDAGGMGGVTLLPGDPLDAYNALTAATLRAGTDQYVVPCDPMGSGMLCSMAVSSGNNPFGSCGNTMPTTLGLPADAGTPTDLTPSDLQTIATWIQCGAPNN